MKKLFIVFNDKSKVTYTIKRSSVDHMQYLNKYPKYLIKSAVLQNYPKKDNEPIILV